MIFWLQNKALQTGKNLILTYSNNLHFLFKRYFGQKFEIFFQVFFSLKYTYR